MSASLLFVQHGQEQREEVLREQPGTLGCGVDAVGLDGSGHGVDVGVEHGKKRHVIARGDLVIHEVKLMDVGGAVVGRERDAGEQDPGVRGEQAGDNGFEVASGDAEWKAAKAVVSAEFDNDNGGVHSEDHGQPVDAVLGGVAADAGVDDAVVVSASGEIALERGGVGLAGLEAVAGGDAVSVANDDGQFLPGGASGEWSERGHEGQKQHKGDAAAVHKLSVATGRGAGRRDD